MREYTLEVFDVEADGSVEVVRLTQEEHTELAGRLAELRTQRSRQVRAKVMTGVAVEGLAMNGGTYYRKTI